MDVWQEQTAMQMLSVCALPVDLRKHGCVPPHAGKFSLHAEGNRDAEVEPLCAARGLAEVWLCTTALGQVRFENQRPTELC